MKFNSIGQCDVANFFLTLAFGFTLICHLFMVWKISNPKKSVSVTGVICSMKYNHEFTIIPHLHTVKSLWNAIKLLSVTLVIFCTKLWYRFIPHRSSGYGLKFGKLNKNWLMWLGKYFLCYLSHGFILRPHRDSVNKPWNSTKLVSVTWEIFSMK